MRRIRIGHINGRIVQTTTVYRTDDPVFVEIETDLSDEEILLNQRVDVAASLSARPVMDVPAEVAAVAGDVVPIAIPDPATVTIMGERARVVGGLLEIEAPPAADTYPIGVSAWPYLDAQIDLVVTLPPSPPPAEET